MWTQDVQESQGHIGFPKLNNSHSLLLSAPAPKTAKPEQNTRPCVALLHAWEKKVEDDFSQKETQDGEIIFNLCPSQAQATPVILAGVIKGRHTALF